MAKHTKTRPVGEADRDTEFDIDQMVGMTEFEQEFTDESTAMVPPIDTIPVVYDGLKGLEAADTDESEVRHNLKQLISDGSVAFDRLLKVAGESESPRAFEVVAAYLKTLGDLNKQLLDVHTHGVELRNKLGQKTEEVKPEGETNVYVGSTEDLLDMMEARKGKKS